MDGARLNAPHPSDIFPGNPACRVAEPSLGRSLRRRVAGEAKEMDAPQGAPGTQGVVMAVSGDVGFHGARSEEHTSELQSLMRISYAVFCLKKKTDHLTIRAQAALEILHRTV